MRSKLCRYVSWNFNESCVIQRKEEHSGTLVTSPHNSVAEEEVRRRECPTPPSSHGRICSVHSGDTLTHLVWHCRLAWHSHLPFLLSLRRSCEIFRPLAKSPRSFRFHSLHGNSCRWCT